MLSSRIEEHTQKVNNLNAKVQKLRDDTEAYWRQLATPLLNQLVIGINVKVGGLPGDKMRVVDDVEAKALEQRMAELITQNYRFYCVYTNRFYISGGIYIHSSSMPANSSDVQEEKAYQLAKNHEQRRLEQMHKQMPVDFTQEQEQDTLACCHSVDELLRNLGTNASAGQLALYIKNFTDKLLGSDESKNQSVVTQLSSHKADPDALTKFTQQASEMAGQLLQEAEQLATEERELATEQQELFLIGSEMQIARDAISKFSHDIEPELRKQLAKHYKNNSALYLAIARTGVLNVAFGTDDKLVLSVSGGQIRPAHELKIPAGDKKLLDLATKYGIASELSQAVNSCEGVVKQAEEFSRLYDDANRKLLKTRPDDFTKYLLKKFSRAISTIRAWLGKERTTFHRHPEGRVVTGKLDAIKGRLATNPHILHAAPRGGNKPGVDETSTASAAVDPRGVKPKV